MHMGVPLLQHHPTLPSLWGEELEGRCWECPGPCAGSMAQTRDRSVNPSRTIACVCIRFKNYFHRRRGLNFRIRHSHRKPTKLGWNFVVAWCCRWFLDVKDFPIETWSSLTCTAHCWGIWLALSPPKLADREHKWRQQKCCPGFPKSSWPCQGVRVLPQLAYYLYFWFPSPLQLAWQASWLWGINFQTLMMDISKHATLYICKCMCMHTCVFCGQTCQGPCTDQCESEKAQLHEWIWVCASSTPGPWQVNLLSHWSWIKNPTTTSGIFLV